MITKYDYSREQLCLLWLYESETLARSTIRQLLEKYGSAENVWDRFSTEIAPHLGKAGTELAGLRGSGGFDRIVQKLEDTQARAVFTEETEYPEPLRYIEDRPEMLFVKGTIPDAPAVAVVGSRRDTRYGRQQAFSIAKELSQNGITIVSGLARGIDTAAHEGALAGGGKTVAVLGCGVDVCYPPENSVLMNNILRSGGAVISELAPGAKPLSYHFPLRNRIISGICDALLLIEARFKSGTNSTVNYAISQGKEVFCLPGNVDSPGSELPLKLLQEGAAMCIRADDILYAMHWKSDAQEYTEQTDLFETDDPILKALSMEEKSFEELIEETGYEPGKLSADLTVLEMQGLIEKRAGRNYAVIRN